MQAAPNNIKAKVLVIDDEAVVHESCQRILNPEGYRVEKAFGGQEAFERMHRENFDIVITDLKMPGMSGMEALERIKKERADVAVIMITGFSTVETAVRAMKLGAIDYLPKPFTPDELTNVVNKALDKRRVLLETKHLESSFEEAGKAISSSLNLAEVLNLIVSSVVKLVNGKASSITLCNPEGAKEIRAQFGLSARFLKDGEPEMEKILREVYDNKVIFIKFVKESSPSRSALLPLLKEEELVGLIAYPLMVKGRVIGNLKIYLSRLRDFTAEEKEIMKSFAEQAAMALENARMYEKVAEDYQNLKKELPQIMAKDLK